MRLARTIRFDESDKNIFSKVSAEGELAVSGAFAFSDLREDELRGKLRQEFANGWLGLESFGRSTFVAVCNVTQAEIDAVTVRLAAHFTAEWGAPSLHDALPVAEDEIRYMREMCEEHAPNTLLVVERHIAEDGVREAFRTLVPAEADLGDILGAEAAAHAAERMGD